MSEIPGEGDHLDKSEVEQSEKSEVSGELVEVVDNLVSAVVSKEEPEVKEAVVRNWANDKQILEGTMQDEKVDTDFLREVVSYFELIHGHVSGESDVEQQLTQRRKRLTEEPFAARYDSKDRETGGAERRAVLLALEDTLGASEMTHEWSLLNYETARDLRRQMGLED